MKVDIHMLDGVDHRYEIVDFGRLQFGFVNQGGSGVSTVEIPSFSQPGGRDRASATTLDLPSMYRISVVYSETHAS